MGSSLSPVIANLYMNYFEREALQKTKLKPSFWKRYVDDIFIIWPHGREELDIFLEELNNIHHRIQFTLEVEVNRQLPFLDLLITRNPDQTLDYTVYRKPTHTNRYLNANSHHHPPQIQSVANTLVSRSFRLTKPTNRQQELQKISTALEENNYKKHNIKKAIRQNNNPAQRAREDNQTKEKTTLPYIRGVTDVIGRMLRKHNISTAYKPQTTIHKILGNPKDKKPLENHGVYSIPCNDCGKQYVGQTNRRISARVQEHKNSIRNKQTTSALFQHFQDTGHTIDFENTKQVACIKHYRTRTIREAIEIEKSGHLNRRDDAQNIATAWKTLIQKQPPKNSQQRSDPKTTLKQPQVQASVNTTRVEQRYNLRPRQV